RIEVGVSTDLTNEQFYEESYSDTTFHPRRLVSTPESRAAGVLLASLNGTRGQGTAQYQVQNLLSVGDKVRHELLELGWRHDLTPEWRYALSPKLEYRRDRTFDRDLEEW